MVNRHQKQWSQLEGSHQRKIGKIKVQTKRAVGKKIDVVRGEFRPLWEEIYHQQNKAVKEHHKREGSKVGRMRNAIKSIRFKDLLKSDQRKQVLSEAFGVISNGDHRLAVLKAKLDKQSKALANEQSKAEKEASIPYRQKERQQTKEAKQRYITDRASLILSHQLDQTQQNSIWKTRRQDRIRAFEMANVKRPIRDAFKEASNDIAQPQTDKPQYNQDQLNRLKMLEPFRNRSRPPKDNDHDNDRDM